MTSGITASQLVLLLNYIDERLLEERSVTYESDGTAESCDRAASDAVAKELFDSIYEANLATLGLGTTRLPK